MRLTKCKVCRTLFQKMSISHKVCKPECAIILNTKEKEQTRRTEHLKAKVKARTRAEWLKLAQAAFNAFIRKRDESEPCISCGRHHNGQYHAGHYFTVGARPELRFNEDNNNKQCAPCNNHLSGNIALYRQGLLKKIGQERLDILEGYHPPKKYTIEDCQEIIKTYKAKLKSLHSAVVMIY